MAVLTLADLVAQVADEIGRDGEEQAIRWAIDRTTMRANRLLRTRWMLCRASAPVSIAVNDGDEYLALGDDFAGMIGARFIDTAGTATDLKFLYHREAAQRAHASRMGPPCDYALYENQIRLLPRSDRAGTLEIWTYERFGLENDTDTNWLLKYHQDVYVNGATYHVKRRLQYPLSEIKDYESAFLSGISEIRASNAFDQAGGATGEGPDYF